MSRHFSLLYNFFAQFVSIYEIDFRKEGIYMQLLIISRQRKLIRATFQYIFNLARILVIKNKLKFLRKSVLSLSFCVYLIHCLCVIFTTQHYEVSVNFEQRLLHFPILQQTNVDESLLHKSNNSSIPFFVFLEQSNDFSVLTYSGSMQHVKISSCTTVYTIHICL